MALGAVSGGGVGISSGIALAAGTGMRGRGFLRINFNIDSLIYLESCWYFPPFLEISNIAISLCLSVACIVFFEIGFAAGAWD